MKNKRLFSFLLLIVALIALVGCSDDEMSVLWENYVNAVNATDINGVAGTFYDTKSTDYKKFVEENSYFESVNSVETESFEVIMYCDFSNSLNSQGYYKAEVKAKVNGESQEFYAYACKNNQGLFFAQPITVENGKVVSEPSDLWRSQVYYATESFNYSYSDGESTLLRQITNDKEVVIPETFKDEYDADVKVTKIGKYAFYKYNKILCFTTAISKLKSVLIPETITTIGECAFFQCVNLKSIVIPESVDKIEKMAFAGCSDLETITIKRKTEEFVAEKFESSAYGDDENPLIIDNARTLQQGEIYTLTIKKNSGEDLRLVKWSSDSSSVSVNPDTGEIKALSVGQAKIRVELRDNPSVYADVTITIEPIETYLSIEVNAFDRCTGLKELYIDATNPNSIKIVNGTQGPILNLNDTVKIIVPKGSKAMYQTHESWSKYSSQIYEME